MALRPSYTAPAFEADGTGGRTGFQSAFSSPSAPPTRLLALAARVAGAETLWRPLVRHDPTARWHLRIVRTAQLEVWLLGWTPQQAVELHDHGASAGAFIVTEGELLEDRYDACEQRLHRIRSSAGAGRMIEPGSVHRVWNAGPAGATSIHVYSPPLASMTYYDCEPSGALRTKRTEWIGGAPSGDGQLRPDPERAPPTVPLVRRQRTLDRTHATGAAQPHPRSRTMKALSTAPSRPDEARGLAHVVEALAAANQDLLPARRRSRRHALPSRAILEAVVAELRRILFPTHLGAPDPTDDGIRHYIDQRLGSVVGDLEDQVTRELVFGGADGDVDGGACERRAAEITRRFALRLPAIRALLGSDVRAAYEGDPAATSVDEAVFCYPGITAVTHQRIAHELYELGVPLVARIITEIAHGETGIDIHPGAKIGGSFFIDHGTGVVIGETCIIGERVRLYQGVTLGAKGFPTDEHGRPIKGRPRHPIVEDDVTIYAGATILGRITIGRGSTIGGNVWLTRAVPPGSRISQAQIRDDLFDGGSGI